MQSKGGNFKGATLAELAQQARPEFSTEFNLYNVELNHDFSSDWRLRIKYFWQQENRIGVRATSESVTETEVLQKRNELGDYFDVEPIAGQISIPEIRYPQAPEWLYTIGKIRSLFDEEGKEVANNGNFNLEGLFTSGTLIHRLTVGADWHRQDAYKKYIVEVRDLFPMQVWPQSEFKIIVEDLLNIIVDSSKTLGKLEVDELRLLYDDYGVYAQDSIELNSKWVVSAGGRYTMTTGKHFNITDWKFTTLPTYKNFSSQLGLVFKPTEKHSLFFNYSEALRANYNVDDLGAGIDEPETSNQIELGIKSLLMDGHFLSSVSFFNIEKKNIVDPIITKGFRSFVSGHQENVRGMDFDFTLQMSQKFNLMGALSVIDPKIVSGEDNGKKSILVADRTASLFTHYILKNNIELSAGIKYVSERASRVNGRSYSPVDSNNSTKTEFKLDAYTTVDLGVSYNFLFLSKASNFKVAVKNATNKKYHTAILVGVRENLSESRSIVSSLKVDF